MSNTDIRLTIEGSTAFVDMVTEDGLNVGSSPMMRRFSDVVSQVAEDRGVRSTVIRGEGKVFLAGADIKEMSGFDRGKALEYGRLGQSVLNAIEALPSGKRKYCALVGVFSGKKPLLGLVPGMSMPWKPGKPVIRATSAGRASLPIPQYPCCQVWK